MSCLRFVNYEANLWTKWGILVENLLHWGALAKSSVPTRNFPVLIKYEKPKNIVAYWTEKFLYSLNSGIQMADLRGSGSADSVESNSWTFFLRLYRRYKSESGKFRFPFNETFFLLDAFRFCPSNSLQHRPDRVPLKERLCLTDFPLER